MTISHKAPSTQSHGSPIREEKPYTFGIFTDIQYASKPDKEIEYMDRTCMREYSLCLAKAELAVSHFNSRDVSRVLHLGDIIDGNSTPAATLTDLTAVLSVLSKVRAPLSHAVGNHCLEIGRKAITHQLHLPTQFPAAHSALDLTATWRILLLDTMACSVHGPATETLLAAAHDHLERHPDAPNSSRYNGGLGAPQLAWLRAELERARATGVNVIVVGHHPVAAGAAPVGLLLWHADALMQMFAEFKQTVRAVFSGHYHYGGYIQDGHGIHHVVFESILDSRIKEGSYGIVSLFDDRIEIEGHGEMTSRVLKFATAHNSKL